MITIITLLLFYYLFITLVTGVIWAHTISVCLPSTSLFLSWKSSLAMDTLIYVNAFVILIDVALSLRNRMTSWLEKFVCCKLMAKAILNQFEEEQQYSELKKQLNAVFDSDSDREAQMTAFGRCVQRIGESEEEFMTHLLQLYKAADPQAKTNVINHAVKRKFLQGISDTLQWNIFIFGSNLYDEKVSHQDLLKASWDASVHLSLPSTVATAVSDAVLTGANPSG